MAVAGTLCPVAVTWAQEGGTDGQSRLAPLTIRADAVAGANVPTEGYTVDSSTGATKTDTPLIRTPQTVDVVTRDQIEDQGARTINNALRYTPGVFTGLAGSSSRQTTVSLRGFPGGDVNNTFLDGLRLQSDPGGYTNIQIDPFFLERIDVVKGPSSVLYGRAQPGGLVNFVTKKPQAEQQGLLRVYGGSFDTYGAGFDVTGALPDKDLGSYRIVASGERSDTQYDVVESERYTVMPSVEFNLAEDTELLLQAYLQKEPEGGFHGAVPYDLSVSGQRFGRRVDDDWVDTAEDFERFERDTQIYAYQLTHRATDRLTLRSKAQYTDAEVDLEQTYQTGFIDDTSQLSRFGLAADENLKAFAIDNNAQYELTTGPIEHTVLAGFDFQRRENQTRSGFAAAGSLDPFNPDYSSSGVSNLTLGSPEDRKTRQVGFYLQDQMAWNRFNLVLSGRQDYLKREYVNASQSGIRASRSDDAFSGRAAVLYESAWGISPYASYSEAFNPGAFAPNGSAVAPPVESHQYEAGLKYQPRGLNAFFTLAFYDLLQENVQQRGSVSPPTFIAVGDVQSRGVELSAKVELTERLRVMASYSRSETEYQNDYINTAGALVRAGNRPPRTPDDQASLWVEGDLSPALSGGLGLRYVGESAASDTNEREVPDFTLMDGFVRYDLADISTALKGTSIQLNANNLFNKEYVEACFNEQYCYFGTPRSVVATLDYRF